MAQHFDVCIAGTQLSGLLAAALLAKGGRRVVFCDHDEAARHYPCADFWLPFEPPLQPHLEDVPHVQRMHATLGIVDDLRRAQGNAPSRLQVALPGHRLDIGPSRSSLLEELHRAFPDDAPCIDDVMCRVFELDHDLTRFLGTTHGLPPTGFWQRLRAQKLLQRLAGKRAQQSFAQLLGALHDTHPLRALLQNGRNVCGHDHDANPSAFAALRALLRLLDGSRLPRHGHTLFDVAKRAAVRAGVTFMDDTRIASVTLRRGRVSEVHFAGKAGGLSADYVISNTRGPLSPLAAASRSFDAEERRFRPSGFLLTLNLLVHRDVVPSGMGDAVLVARPAAAPVLLQRLRPSRRGDAARVSGDDADTLLLSASSPVEAAAIEGGPEASHEARTAVHDGVRGVVPFVDDYCQTVSLARPSNMQHSHDGTWHLHPLYSTRKPPLLGVAMRPIRTACKNVLRCGRDVLPSLGLEGEYLTAQAVVDHLFDMAGRRWRRPGAKR